MWDEAAAHLADFTEAVVTALDPDGYPVSVRQPAGKYDTATGELTLEWPPGLAVAEGPATVLCHSHDDKLWSIKLMHIKGRLAPRGAGWVFISTAFAPPPRSQLGVMRRAARDMRRQGKRYLARRGLQKPKVNWRALEALCDGDAAKME